MTEGEFSLESADAIKQLPDGYGDAVRLFRAVDTQLQEEVISPNLAKTLRQTFVAVEQQKPGTLQNLVIKGSGGIRFAASQLEPGLIEVANAMEASGEGKAGDVITEYMKWAKTDEQPKTEIKLR